MKKEWHLPNTLPLSGGRELEFDEVLVFYEEPQIGIVSFDADQYLAVAADEEREEGVTRWLLAGVTHSAILAIKTGAQTLREAFEAHETIRVVDTNKSFEVQDTYQATVSNLAENCLPDRGAFLPSRVCEQYRDELQDEPSSLHVEGESVTDHILPFRVASDLFGELQRMWNALAQVAKEDSEITRQGAVPADLRNRARLSLVGISEGSAKLDIQAGDPALNERIADLFAGLVRSRLDGQTLHRRLDDFGPRVESAYEALVEAVQRNDVFVFAANQRSTAYLTPENSARIEQLLETYERQTRTRKVHGYFVAFDLQSRSFRFRELDSGQEFEGDVAAEVADGIEEIALGEPKTYEIEVEITRIVSPTDQEKGQETVLTNLDEDI
jgi:hypothetical protein